MAFDSGSFPLFRSPPAPGGLHGLARFDDMRDAFDDLWPEMLVEMLGVFLRDITTDLALQFVVSGASLCTEHHTVLGAESPHGGNAHEDHDDTHGDGRQRRSGLQCPESTGQ